MRSVTLKPDLCHSFDNSVSFHIQWDICDHLNNWLMVVQTLCGNRLCCLHGDFLRVSTNGYTLLKVNNIYNRYIYIYIYITWRYLVFWEYGSYIFLKLYIKCATDWCIRRIYLGTFIFHPMVGPQGSFFAPGWLWAAVLW